VLRGVLIYSYISTKYKRLANKVKYIVLILEVLVSKIKVIVSYKSSYYSIIISSIIKYKIT